MLSSFLSFYFCKHLVECLLLNSSVSVNFLLAGRFVRVKLFSPYRVTALYIYLKYDVSLSLPYLYHFPFISLFLCSRTYLQFTSP